MKISPIPQGQAASPSNVNEGHSASPDRIARAKAIAAGEAKINVMPSDNHVDPQVEKVQRSVRKIQMKTNVSPDREFQTEVVTEAPNEPESAMPDTTETVPVVEDTQPLSPQFAALAKQRRALQAKERELSDREKALNAQPASAGPEALIARIKSEPLSVLREHGVTYDQLTEAILANQSGTNPEIYQLREEIKALKEGVDKTLTDREAQAEQQVLAEIRRESERLAESGEEYEMVRETKSYPEVVELIHRVYKESGEIMDVSEAMQLVEDDLINESLRIANIGKVKNRLTPQTPPQQQPPQQKQIRTLTNRDTASPVLSRRDRALMAALGTLKR